jgi:hypothetical protein
MLLDVAAQIAIQENNLPEAEKYIDQLRRIPAVDDYNFRMAMLHSARKEFRKALPLIEAAMKSHRRRFEVEAAFVDTLIEVRKYQEASDALDSFDRNRRRGRDNESVRLGLRCKLYLRQRKWQDAESVWSKLEDKNSPVHVALRMEILEQKIGDLKTTPGARAAAQDELEHLRATTAPIDASVHALIELDDEVEADAQVEGEDES